MTRRHRSRLDPVECEIELALNPGVFIPYGASFSFVRGLDEVAAKIAKLISNDPARAVTLYETFLAACYLKIEELDDSSGSFGQFVDELYCGWIKARQATKADPDETAKRCFERAGQHDEWSKTVRQVRADHHRKSSFMPGFERLVGGVGPSDEPSFLELAKARWNAKERGAR